MVHLNAGVGKSVIQYTEEMLKNNQEHYNSIHDLPGIQALLLEDGTHRIGFVIVDCVMLSEDVRKAYVHAASTAMQVSEDYIILQAAHVLATPHFSIEDEQIYQSHLKALKEACQMAAATCRAACVSLLQTEALINVNREVNTRQGWWQGVNQNGATDRSIYVLTIRDLDGSLRGVFYNCNVAPGCMEFSEVHGGRAVSGDLAAASIQYVEEMLGKKVVASYTTGATGNQWQMLRARFDYMKPDGTQVIEDLHEVGFTLTRMLGIRLGEQIVKAVLSEPVQEAAEEPLTICCKNQTFSYTGMHVEEADFRNPAHTCRYVEDGPSELPVKVVKIGSLTIVCCGCELTTNALERLRRESECRNLVLLEFATEGGGYLPEAEYYDRVTFQSLKSHFMKGTAEMFVRDIAAWIRKASDSVEKNLA